MWFLFSSMHCFEGPDWLHLKRGRESFPRGPLVKVDPQGRCGGVLVYGLQMIILKTSQVFVLALLINFILTVALSATNFQPSFFSFMNFILGFRLVLD